MVFILFEKNICSFCCVLFDKNSLGSSGDIVLLWHSLLFSGGFPGVKYQEFPRFSIVRLPRKFTVLACCFDCFRAEIGFLSIYNIWSRFASVEHSTHSSFSQSKSRTHGRISSRMKSLITMVDVNNLPGNRSKPFNFKI